MVLSSIQLQKCVYNSVIPPAPVPCKTFCFVCFYQPALSRMCVYVYTMDFMSGHKQNKLNCFASPILELMNQKIIARLMNA